MEKKRIDPESDEYKAWKKGAISLEEEPSEKLQEENIESNNNFYMNGFLNLSMANIP